MNLKTLKSGKMTKVAVVLAVFAVVPFLAFSSDSRKIFVDPNASGNQDGSSSHPFRTIAQAMEKADKRKNKIILAKGVYKENVELKKEVNLIGKGRDKSIIEARSDDRPAVVMGDGSKVNKLTIRDGKDGIRVKENAQAEIVDCDVRDNDDDGIDIEEGSLKDSERVVILDSEIQHNGNAGIFSKKRRLTIMNSEIEENGSDAMNLRRGVSAWIFGNEIRHNGGNGMELVLDNSSIFTKKNRIHSNKKGVEINFFGVPGRIDFQKDSIFKNGEYAIIKVQKEFIQGSEALWKKYVTIGEGNDFRDNEKGNFSPIGIR